MAGTESITQSGSGGDDAAALAALGYTSEYRREMSMWGNAVGQRAHPDRVVRVAIW